ncbi:MAG: hypothetical protein ACREJ0_23570 [Geminicoccaceae bacterium]
MIMGPYYDDQVGRFVPPDPLKDWDILLARARRARAEATADMVGALYGGLKTATKAVAAFVRQASAGAALRPPHGDVRQHGPVHLTCGCG